ncbi:MAG: SPFH domain-containing protein, partial [Candidatus Thermoplasmatota archaeon]|nr:SPFH domain-containing protein [Candidatus Thermoplasmatota archaeon]
LMIVIPVLTALTLWLFGFKLIPNTHCAVVEMRWSRKGSLTNRLIALKGEAGFQPEVLRGGIHFRTPLKYKIHKISLVTIPQGQIGYIFARDGEPLKPKQTLGRLVGDSEDFQNSRGFLENGGQRGPQRGILREGTYAINLVQFVVILQDEIYHLSIDRDDEVTFSKMAKHISMRDGFNPIVIKGKSDNIGIVTAHDGPPLEPGEIIAPLVGDNKSSSKFNHNNFQDPEMFLTAGGQRGKQYQVLVDGTYFINRLFATVQIIPKTVVPVGYVGVVVSYFGAKGRDESGEDYKHGELVEKGHKGVWEKALMPGKYAFNTYAGKVIMVPTTNIVLKWKKNEIGNHKLDENLSAVDLISKDAFEPELPLSVVIHIDYRKAPLVIQRFGDVKKLVDQTLDPMVAAYFKNIGQTKTLIQLIQERNEIQEKSSNEMRDKFLHYDLELEEVLIGTPSSSENDGRIETILVQLRDRQIAREQLETYERQEEAALKEKELNEAKAKAKQQRALTESEIEIDIQRNSGKADLERSLQEAHKIRALADADAEKEAKVGIAKAIAVEEQVRAYGGPRYQVLQQSVERFAKAVETSGVDVVPKMYVAGSDGGSFSSAFDNLINLLISEKMGIEVGELGKISEQASKIKKTILGSIDDPEGIKAAEV